MTKRVDNFNPGPAVLPVEVLQQAQAEMLDYKGTGMSVMEISHRSKEFEAIVTEAQADLRESARNPSQLQDLIPARRRQPAFCHGSDEFPPGRNIGRLHCHRHMEQESFEGIPETGDRQSGRQYGSR